MCYRGGKLTQASVIDWHLCQSACVLPLCRIKLWNLNRERWPWWKTRTCLINLCQIKVSSPTRATERLSISFSFWNFPPTGIFFPPHNGRSRLNWCDDILFFNAAHTWHLYALFSFRHTQGNSELCYSTFQTATHWRRVGNELGKKRYSDICSDVTMLFSVKLALT